MPRSRSAKCMIARITCVWVTVTTAAASSFCLWVAANWFANLKDQKLEGRHLPAISSYFYPPAFWPYLFPMLLGAWALYITTARRRMSQDRCMLFCTVGACAMILFIAVFAFAIAVPLLPMKICRLQQP